MEDTNKAREFLALFAGSSEVKWDAILLSGGGNDLIDAIWTPPTDASGTPYPRAKRILLTKAEWGGGSQPSRYVSDEGWDTFVGYLKASFQTVAQTRAASQFNRSTPIFCHVYDYATPRNAPAATFPIPVGPWLYKAVQRYGVPESDWIPLARTLIDRMAEAILESGIPNLHVVDARGSLTPATTRDTGATADWQNEIHPTRQGYGKHDQKWSSMLARL